MKHFHCLAIALLGAVACAQAQPDCTVPAGTSPFEFKSGQNTLRGFIDRPKAPGKHPAILIVHGSGSTDVTRGNGGYNSSYDEMRAAFRRSGLATVIWDNAGRGLHRADGRVAAGACGKALARSERTAGITTSCCEPDVWFPLLSGLRTKS